MQATAIAHPNVALIKYWGKRAVAGNVPAVGSLSIVLGGLTTTTSVTFRPELHGHQLVLNGADDEKALPRVSACLDELRQRAGCALFARVVTRNDFPTGAGLASSASGFAALLVAAAAALDLKLGTAEMATLARHGSGSAPRSLHGGFVQLLPAGDSVRCEPLATTSHWPLEVVVAVTTAGPKSVGSRDGMQRSEQTSPYYAAWVESHAADLAHGIEAVARRDFAELAKVSEHNCLKMHAVMQTSVPSLIYWTPATLACMQRIQELRRDGVPVFFTVDAGPQVKAVCLPEAAATVTAELRKIPGVLQLLRSALGEGARRLEHPHPLPATGGHHAQPAAH
jgi:diphosphomevalonate decarboxylase